MNSFTIVSLVGVLFVAICVWILGAGVEPLLPMLAPWAVRIGLIVGLLAVWGLALLLRSYLRMRREMGLVRAAGTASAADEPVAEADAAGDEELETIGSRLQEALETLRREGAKGASLYELPWYMIIGPPGAGKTTVLQNSGLHFPGQQVGDPQAIKGVGGTRYCDWWLAEEAVLIDTAGRYTTQDSDHDRDREAWFGFLDMLKQQRPRRPVNGVIVAISLTDLADAGSMATHAREIRARIDELHKQLGVRLPVYLLVTKADLINGFNEFFVDYNDQDRKQVWGFSFEAGTTPDQLGAAVEAELAKLVEALGERQLDHVHAQKNIRNRAAVGEFPRQFASLSALLGGFVDKTFVQRSRGGESPLLRGIFFTSGTQTGSPIDRMLQGVYRNFGIQRALATPFQGTSKAYFIEHLLKDLIIPEAELTGEDPAVRRRTLMLRTGVFAAIGVLTIALVALWYWSYDTQRAYAAQIGAHLETYRSEREALGEMVVADPARTLPELEPLWDAATLRQASGFDWITRLGMTSGRLPEAARLAYHAELETVFLSSVRTQLERELARADFSSIEVVEMLKVYLMLALEDHRDEGEIRDWFERYWTRSYRGQDETVARLLHHLDQVFEADRFPNFPMNDQLVAEVRAAINGFPPERRIYQALRNDPELSRPVTFDLGPDAARLFEGVPMGGRVTMPFLFTAQGYARVNVADQEQLLRRLRADQWVYGSGAEALSAAQLEQLESRIEALYLRDYAGQWQALLEPLRIRRPQALADAAERVGLASDDFQSPIRKVLELVSEQTRLAAVAQAAAGALSGAAGALGGDALGDRVAAATRVEPTAVDRGFAGIHQLLAGSGGNSRLGAALNDVGDLLLPISRVTDSPSRGAEAVAVAAERFRGAGADPFARIRRESARLPDPLQGWVRDLAASSWQLLFGTAQSHLDDEWQRQVCSPFDRRLANAYPFDAASARDADLRDFGELFGPEGEIQRFVGSALADFIDVDDGFKPRTLDGQGLSLGGAGTRQLAAARRINEGWFPDGNPDVQVSLVVTPREMSDDVAEFEMSFGDFRLRYAHGPQFSESLAWPGALPDALTLSFNLLDGDFRTRDYPGDWSVFRMFADADVSTIRPGVFRAKVEVQGATITLDVTSENRDAELSTRVMTGFRCGSLLGR